MKLISYLKKKFWNWPDSFVWKITEKATVKSRRRKYTLFISLVKPKPEETILDVGVSPYFGRVSNYLELWYPHPEQITALTNDEEGKFKNFRERFPKVSLIFGDGRNLDFPEGFLSLFPSGKPVRLFKQKILGASLNLIAVVEKKTSFEEGLG